jgi:hypothetical protein
MRISLIFITGINTSEARRYTINSAAPVGNWISKQFGYEPILKTQMAAGSLPLARTAKK